MPASAQPPLKVDWVDDSAALLVSFGGLGGRKPLGDTGESRLQFIGSTSHYPVNKLFLRDVDQSWYHRGIPGVADGIDGLADYLANVIDERRCRRVVFLGTSSGGYAALLLGWLLGVDEVHAISPRTFLDMENRKRHGDFRAIKFAPRLYQSDWRVEAYFDLVEVFSRGLEPDTRFHIYYSRLNRLDRTHATRMAASHNVELHEFEDSSHVLAHKLTRSGYLDEVLRDSLRILPDR